MSGYSRRRRGGGADGTEHVTPELTRVEWEEKAREIVLRQLTMMDRSRHQLDEAMKKREVPEDVRCEILDRYEEIGLVNDSHFAEVLVRTRFQEKGASRRAIGEELRKKGVSPEVAAQALLAIDDDAEYEAAVSLAVKKLTRASGNPQTLYRRVYGALARKGYSPGVCSRAMKEATSRIPCDEPGDLP